MNEIRCIQPVAESRRREILNYLALEERSVSEIVQVFAFVGAVPRLHIEVENVHHNMGSLVQ